MNKKFRQIIFYKQYFHEFFIALQPKVQKKMIWTFDLIEELNRVPEVYLKHIQNTDGLYEIRVQNGNDIFRIFCFFKQDQCIIIGNGFQKKTEKTPKNQIQLAQKIKDEYEKEHRK